MEKDMKPAYYEFKFRTEKDAKKAADLFELHGINAIRDGNTVRVPIVAKYLAQNWLNKEKITWEEGVPAFIAPSPQTKPATPQEILEQHEARISAIEDTVNTILGQIEVLIRAPQRAKTLHELKLREALR